MKKILFFIWAFIPFVLFSQSSNYIINDNFNDNSHGWSVGDDGELKEWFGRGFYFLQNKTSDSYYRSWTKLHVNENKDFKFEAGIKLVKGKDDAYYGLSWAAYGWKNEMGFIINSNGEYTIYYYKDGEFHNLDYGRSSAIKRAGIVNNFTVKKTGNKYYFYINGQLLHSCDYVKAFGTSWGFYLDPQTTIGVDYFRVYQPKAINLAAGALDIKDKKPLSILNTKHSEIAPVISPDGKTLYFGRSKEYFYEYGTSDFDIWYSTRKPDGSWSAPKKLNASWNNKGDNIVIASSPDNNSLLVEGLYDKYGAYSDKGISITFKQKDGSWSVPKQVKIDNYVNLGEYETFCPSADGKVLILAVTRPEGYGGEDLYVSFRQPDGTYSKPKNLGPVLNTFGDEATPFLAPDGKTLYFSSDGHPGYGSMDIFVTKRLGDGWFNWSVPKNLGPKVNNKDWNTYLSIAAQGDVAFMSESTPTGGEDIFIIELNKEAQPEPVVIVSGKVLDKKTNKPLSADIEYQDVNTGKQLGIARSNPATGEFKIVLNPGKKYALIAKKKNYVSITENIDLSAVKNYKEISRNIYLAPIEVGEVIQMHNILFRRGTDRFLPSAYPELDRLVNLMKENPNIEIMLMGHTNNIGDHDKLVALSEKRVEAVKKYLVDHGIDPKRIKGKGYGPDKPIASNETPEGRQKNQRVEFKIIKK